jgi:hypothetical protein
MSRVKGISSFSYCPDERAVTLPLVKAGLGWLFENRLVEVWYKAFKLIFTAEHPCCLHYAAH